MRPIIKVITENVNRTHLYFELCMSREQRIHHLFCAKEYKVTQKDQQRHTERETDATTTSLSHASL